MTDRELIDLAAKAADIPLVDLLDSYGDFGGLEREGWNPLKNDGEALRLAVKLRISLSYDQEYVGVVIETVEAKTKNRSFIECINELHTDENAVVRRAIVMAAAEIGRGMK